MNDLNYFFENLAGRGTKLHQSSKKFIIKEINGDELFERTEVTYVDNEGPKTEELVTVHPAGCGHFVGFNGPKDLKATCSKCGKRLCEECRNLRCRRCFSILCDSCAKLVNENTVYCSKCRIIHYSKKLSLFSLKSLHKLLSKEIS